MGCEPAMTMARAMRLTAADIIHGTIASMRRRRGMIPLSDLIRHTATRSETRICADITTGSTTGRFDSLAVP